MSQSLSLRNILYGIALAEVILFVWLDIIYSIFVLFCVIIIMLLGKVMHLSNQPSKWVSFRDQIKDILIANSIIKTDIPNYTEDNDNNIDEVILLNNLSEDFIETIRYIGIDSIIILVLLMQNLPNYISVQAILKTLYIPRSTLYRNLNKLEEMDYINSRNTFQNPGRSYYSITELGESLVVELHEIIGGNYLHNLR